MADEKHSGVREILIATAGTGLTGGSPTGFTSLGRPFPSDPSFQAIATDDGQGYPLYSHTEFEWDIHLPVGSHSQTLDDYHNSTCDIAIKRIDNTYECLDTVTLRWQPGPHPMGGRAATRLILSTALRDVTGMFESMSASTGSALGAASGSNTRWDRVNEIHFNDGSNDYEITKVGEDPTYGMNSPTLKFASKTLYQLGHMFRGSFRLLDRSIGDPLNTIMLADTLMTEFDIDYKDGTQLNLTSVGFTVVPIVPGSVGGLVGWQVDVVAYSDDPSDYLTWGPAFS